MSAPNELNYVSNFKKFLSTKDSSPNPADRASKNSTTAPSKDTLRILLSRATPCNICFVLQKPGDLGRILNQGLYNKYTSTQDYFYSKDINAIISNRRKPATIRHKDNAFFDEDKEFFKKYYVTSESRELMIDIKDFYTKFKDFPKNFDMPFFKILAHCTRKHRRVEYMKVFKNMHPESVLEQVKFSFLILKDLGESYLKQDAINEISKKIDQPQIHSGRLTNPDSSLSRKVLDSFTLELQTNFKNLRLFNEPEKEIPLTNNLAESFTSRKYVLYTRHDSEAAEEELQKLIQNIEANKPKEPKNYDYSDIINRYIESKSAMNSKIATFLSKNETTSHQQMMTALGSAHIKRINRNNSNKRVGKSSVSPTLKTPSPMKLTKYQPASAFDSVKNFNPSPSPFLSQSSNNNMATANLGKLSVPQTIKVTDFLESKPQPPENERIIDKINRISTGHKHARSATRLSIPVGSIPASSASNSNSKRSLGGKKDDRDRPSHHYIKKHTFSIQMPYPDSGYNLKSIDNCNSSVEKTAKPNLSSESRKHERRMIKSETVIPHSTGSGKKEFKKSYSRDIIEEVSELNLKGNSSTSRMLESSKAPKITELNTKITLPGEETTLPSSFEGKATLPLRYLLVDKTKFKDFKPYMREPKVAGFTSHVKSSSKDSSLKSSRVLSKKSKEYSPEKTLASMNSLHIALSNTVNPKKSVVKKMIEKREKISKFVVMSPSEKTKNLKKKIAEEIEVESMNKNSATSRTNFIDSLTMAYSNASLSNTPVSKKKLLFGVFSSGKGAGNMSPAISKRK